MKAYLPAGDRDGWIRVKVRGLVDVLEVSDHLNSYTQVLVGYVIADNVFARPLPFLSTLLSLDIHYGSIFTVSCYMTNNSNNHVEWVSIKCISGEGRFYVPHCATTLSFTFSEQAEFLQDAIIPLKEASLLCNGLQRVYG